MRPFLLTLSLLVLATPGAAQVAAATQAESSAADLLRQRVASILRIPTRADEVRQAGVADSTVRSVLDILRGRQVPAEQVEVILTAERDAAREHGPTDNFGAFVQSQLDRGLRGRELAAAIRAEHAQRGKNRGNRPAAAAARGKRPDSAAPRGNRPDSAAAPRGKRPST